jgi:ribosomal protein RSM22 (predicted rRNA methylase)
VAIAESYDLIVLGQVLSELDRDADGATRVRRHVELLGRLAGHLVPGGSLVVVEPALRDRTRHLHAVRDALLEVPGDPRLWVRAPCVHDDPCPMLRNEDDWCHEDLAVDLPSWLVPVARAAGLRWQGLTFSYLVLGRGVRTESAGSSVRVVSAPRITKGKRELFLCGDLDATGRATCVKGMRLDRHRSASNADWDEAARGDVLSFSPPLDLARPRVLSETTVRKAGRD